jgi:predicted Zn-dependent protease with MMP-like domain
VATWPLILESNTLHFDPNTFARLIREAVDLLPDQFRAHMENVSIDIEPLPDADACRELELDSPYDLLGLYRGVPLTERNVEYPPMLPDRIVIYQRSIESACRSEQDAVEQIRTTVLHEIGHFFGLDEDDLEDLGYR